MSGERRPPDLVQRLGIRSYLVRITAVTVCIIGRFVLGNIGPVIVIVEVHVIGFRSIVAGGGTAFLLA
jgi:hypothetical protein